MILSEEKILELRLEELETEFRKDHYARQKWEEQCRNKVQSFLEEYKIYENEAFSVSILPCEKQDGELYYTAVIRQELKGRPGADYERYLEWAGKLGSSQEYSPEALSQFEGGNYLEMRLEDKRIKMALNPSGRVALKALPKVSEDKQFGFRLLKYSGIGLLAGAAAGTAMGLIIEKQLQPEMISFFGLVGGMLSAGGAIGYNAEIPQEIKDYRQNFKKALAGEKRLQPEINFVYRYGPGLFVAVERGNLREFSGVLEPLAKKFGQEEFSLPTDFTDDYPTKKRKV